MVRPKRCRIIEEHPEITYFKPQGIPLSDLEEITLHIDEYEAIRLKDLEGLDQEVAAAKMGISQPTLFRLLTSGHKKIAEALVKGKAIKIEGGNVCKNVSAEECQQHRKDCPLRKKTSNPQ
jgi:predicted DNA-binding protein (UPF0251 family)